MDGGMDGWMEEWEGAREDVRLGQKVGGWKMGGGWEGGRDSELSRKQRQCDYVTKRIRQNK